MTLQITTIYSKYSFLSVNCYLIRNDAGLFLVDCGIARAQAALVNDLEAAGCRPGNLKLILLTHGDLDHSGNCAALRRRYSARIAMHQSDLVNVQTGDMFANKNTPPVARTIANGLFAITGLSAFERFTPDLYLDGGQDLSEFGLKAAAIHVPGHSQGSLAFLTSEGDLFCGDLLENTKKPVSNSLADDANRLSASVLSLKEYPVKTVYPGHGKPFAWEQLMV